MSFLDDAAVIDDKITLRPLPGTADVRQWLRPTEWNDAMGKLLDLRLGLVAAEQLAFTPQATRPAAYANGGQAQRLWVRNADKHLLYYDGTADVDISAAAGGGSTGDFVFVSNSVDMASPEAMIFGGPNTGSIVWNQGGVDALELVCPGGTTALLETILSGGILLQAGFTQLQVGPPEINFSYNGSPLSYWEPTTNTFNPFVDGVGTLGNTTHRWGTVYTMALSAGPSANLLISTDTGQYINFAPNNGGPGTGFYMDGTSISPFATNTYTLGNTTYEWSAVYTSNVQSNSNSVQLLDASGSGMGTTGALPQVFIASSPYWQWYTSYFIPLNANTASVGLTGYELSGVFTVNLSLGIGADFAGSAGAIAMLDATTTPSGTPSGGGVLYVDSGALKYKGSSGTVTPIAPA